MNKKFQTIALAAAAAIALTACGGGSSSSSSSTSSSSSSTTSSSTSGSVPTTQTITGSLTGNMTLTAGTPWLLNGKVIVPSGITLTIEAGAVIAGMEGTAAWLQVLPGGKIYANGTAAAPVTFTSEAALNGQAEGSGQWGGLTIIGNGANAQNAGGYEVDGILAGTSGETSGSLTHIVVNNTGIAVEQDKEINGVSFFGVTANTTVSDVVINRSGDDGIEVWGGSVNLANVKIDGAEDDSFDTDQGWTGAVDGLTITNGKYSGIEMSGTTRATYKNVNIKLEGAENEGALYFKAGDGEVTGGNFENVAITYNSANKGAIYVHGAFDTQTTMKNVSVGGTNTKFVGKAATDAAAVAEVTAIYNAQ